MAVALAIARDHPAYSGHFPSQPILPGVVLLVEVLAAIELVTGKPALEWEIANTKFVAPVTPGMPLTLEHSATDSASLRFEVRSTGGVVASGVLSRVES